MEEQMLTLGKFEEASEVVKRVTLETKLVYSDFLSDKYNNKIYLKPENMQFTGAYKVRGAYYKISTLSDDERKRGLITASAGNHAQGVAYAAKAYGEELTFKDLGFYILYQENKIEAQAAVYNKNSTKDYWNIHTNGYFMQAQVKDSIMECAIHDRIFYRLAEENNVVLSTDETKLLENRRTDFWADLYSEQLERIPGDYNSVNETIKEIFNEICILF